MNKIFLKSCAMVLVFAAASFAQGWKGFYIGGNVGGVNNNSDAFTSTVAQLGMGYFNPSGVPVIAAVGHQQLGPSGFTGGGQAGYNFQAGHWVLGVEADIGSMNVQDDRTGTGTYPCCAPTTFTIHQTVDSDWLFTARPRLGVANAKILVYGTGGVALTNFNYTEVFTDTYATARESASTSGLLAGWTGGGGVEFKIGGGRHWSLKAEYLFADFGAGLKTTSNNLTAVIDIPPPPPPPSSLPARATAASGVPTPLAFHFNVFTHRADLTTSVFRAGFDYRF